MARFRDHQSSLSPRAQSSSTATMSLSAWATDGAVVTTWAWFAGSVAAGLALGRCNTRNGTDTVGAGSPGARSGPVRSVLERLLASGWVGADAGPGERSCAGRLNQLALAGPSARSCQDSDQGSDLVSAVVSRGSSLPRRRWFARPCRRARAVAEALSRAPPPAPAPSQSPIGSSGLRQISSRRDRAGRGLRAANSRATNRGDSRGSNSRRRNSARTKKG